MVEKCEVGPHHDGRQDRREQRREARADQSETYGPGDGIPHCPARVLDRTGALHKCQRQDGGGGELGEVEDGGGSLGAECGGEPGQQYREGEEVGQPEDADRRRGRHQW